jgi:hypothetical protein
MLPAYVGGRSVRRSPHRTRRAGRFSFRLSRVLSVTVPAFCDKSSGWSIERQCDRRSTTLLALGGGEREFGRSKHTYGLAFLGVRGIERVRLRAD